jgi:hypothetical protein
MLHLHPHLPAGGDDPLEPGLLSSSWARTARHLRSRVGMSPILSTVNCTISKRCCIPSCFCILSSPS